MSELFNDCVSGIFTDSRRPSKRYSGSSWFSRLVKQIIVLVVTILVALSEVILVVLLEVLLVMVVVVVWCCYGDGLVLLVVRWW